MLSIAILMFILANNNKPFIPPPFDSTALSGTPQVPNNLGYSPLDVEQGYKAFICGNIAANNGNVDIYFTSPETNTVWLQLQILSERGEVLAETGILKPNEYVKSVVLQKGITSDTNVMLKIIAFAPDSFVSMGTVSLNTTLKKGG